MRWLIHKPVISSYKKYENKNNKTDCLVCCFLFVSITNTFCQIVSFFQSWAAPNTIVLFIVELFFLSPPPILPLFCIVDTCQVVAITCEISASTHQKGKTTRCILKKQWKNQATFALWIVIKSIHCCCWCCCSKTSLLPYDQKPKNTSEKEVKFAQCVSKSFYTVLDLELLAMTSWLCII